MIRVQAEGGEGEAGRWWAWQGQGQDGAAIITNLHLGPHPRLQEVAGQTGGTLTAVLQ